MKKKSDSAPSIYDFLLRKSERDYMKIISNQNPEESSVKLNEKEEKKMKTANRKTKRSRIIQSLLIWRS